MLWSDKFAAHGLTPGGPGANSRGPFKDSIGWAPGYKPPADVSPGRPTPPGSSLSPANKQVPAQPSVAPRIPTPKPGPTPGTGGVNTPGAPGSAVRLPTPGTGSPQSNRASRWWPNLSAVRDAAVYAYNNPAEAGKRVGQGFMEAAFPQDPHLPLSTRTTAQQAAADVGSGLLSRGLGQSALQATENVVGRQLAPVLHEGSGLLGRPFANGLRAIGSSPLAQRAGQMLSKVPGQALWRGLGRYGVSPAMKAISGTVQTALPGSTGLASAGLQTLINAGLEDADAAGMLPTWAGGTGLGNKGWMPTHEFRSQTTPYGDSQLTQAIKDRIDASRADPATAMGQAQNAAINGLEKYYLNSHLYKPLNYLGASMNSWVKPKRSLEHELGSGVYETLARPVYDAAGGAGTFDQAMKQTSDVVSSPWWQYTMGERGPMAHTPFPMRYMGLPWLNRNGPAGSEW